MARAITLLIALAVACPAHADNPKVRAAFLEKYTPHAEAIRDAYTNIRVKWVAKSYGKDTVQTSVCEGKFNRDNFILSGKSSFHYLKTGEHRPFGGNTIEVRNARYGFELNPRPDNDYLLKSLTMHDSKKASPLCLFSVPFADTTRALTFLEMAKDPTTEFIALRDCVWEGQPMTELVTRFTRVHPESKNTIKPYVSYYFDSTRRWICCGSRAYRTEGEQSQYFELYSYEPTAGSEFPKLAKLEDFERDAQAPGGRRCFRSTEVTDFGRCPPFPDADFRLSAFGLPEPVDVAWEDNTPRYYLWLSLAGLLALVLALVFGRLAKKQRDAAAG